MKSKPTYKELQEKISILEMKLKNKQKNENLILYDLFNNLNSGVAIYDVIDNGRDFIFKDFNKAAERIDRQKREELFL